MVDRFDGPPEMQPYVNGDYVLYSDYAELATENERLRAEWEAAANAARMRQEVINSLKALSRTGSVKVDRQRLNIEISKWATDSDLHITIGDVEALHLAILSALEPAAPEGRQEPVACGGCGETNPDNRCIGCLHSFTRPAEQAVTEAMVEAACRAYNAHLHGKGCPVWEEEHPPMRAALKAAMEAGG